MKVAIVSDTHDNISNLQKAIDFVKAEGITTILHCGDICNKDTVALAEERFGHQIVWVKGNGDYELDDIPDTADLDLGGKKVAMVHYPDLAKRLAESGKYDIVFYGHSHRPWEEKIGNCRVVNPGELAGHRYKPTFAIYDTQTDKLELKIIEKL